MTQSFRTRVSGCRSLGTSAGFETTTVAARADLAISKSDDPDPVGNGETLTYTLDVENQGPDTAQAVEVTDELPGSVTFESATVTESATVNGSIAAVEATEVDELAEIAAWAGVAVTAVTESPSTRPRRDAGPGSRGRVVSGPGLTRPIAVDRLFRAPLRAARGVNPGWSDPAPRPRTRRSARG